MREVLAMNGALNNTVVEEGEAVFELAEKRASERSAEASRAASLLLEHSPGRAGQEVTDFTLWLMLSVLAEELLEQRERLDALEGSPG
jgi:hypothetical protein